METLPLFQFSSHKGSQSNSVLIFHYERPQNDGVMASKEMGLKTANKRERERRTTEKGSKKAEEKRKKGETKRTGAERGREKAEKRRAPQKWLGKSQNKHGRDWPL